MWINRIFVSLVVLFSVCLSSWGEQNENRHSPEAESLLQCLRQIWGKQIISGTMATVNWNINEAEWVHQHTGKWPALNCFDYLHHPYSGKGSWIDYTDITPVLEWHRVGGIVSVMWHWNVPANQTGKYSFYWGTDSDKTTFDVRKIYDPSSSEYKVMISDIDTIASYLKLLKQQKIPVLWRPLHEAGGMWFWWGRDPAACCELWRVMYRRFQKAGLDNLIWVWTQAAAWKKPYSDGYRWYPGDEYVDIVGIDIYNNDNPEDIKSTAYDFLRKASPTKLVALTECGNVAPVSQQWGAGCKWLLFMPWYDHARTGNLESAAFQSPTHSHANAAWWRDAFSCDYVLARDDLTMP